MTLSAFASERRTAAPLLLGARCRRSMSPARTALNSKPAARRCCSRMIRTGRWTDGRTDTRPLHRTFSAYYTGSANKALRIAIAWLSAREFAFYVFQTSKSVFYVFFDWHLKKRKKSSAKVHSSILWNEFTILIWFYTYLFYHLLVIQLNYYLFSLLRLTSFSRHWTAYNVLMFHYKADHSLTLKW